MNKKIILSLIILASVFCIAFPSLAMTEAERQALIQQIIQQINQARAQLAQMQSAGGNWCHTFLVTMEIGDSGDEVSALQTALIREGLLTAFSAPTGYFGVNTFAAVSAFQEKYASDILTPFGLSNGTGRAASSTRAKLNQLYGCADTGNNGNNNNNNNNNNPITPSTPYCTESNWIYSLYPETCPSSGMQTKTWIKIGTCSGGVSHSATETVSCIYQPSVSACTSFVYSDWSACTSSGIKTRTVIYLYPSGCTGGNPVISQACVYSPASTACTENDWAYALFPSTCPESGAQTKAWTKIGTCTGGVDHPESETISCMPPPTANIKVMAGGGSWFDGPSLIISNNSSVSIRWTSTNATSCTASGSWSGSKTTGTGTDYFPNLTASQTYTITCTGESGTATDSVVVNPTAGLTADIKVNGSEGPVTVSNNSSNTLSWSSAGAASCTLTEITYTSDREYPSTPETVFNYGSKDINAGFNSLLLPKNGYTLTCKDSNNNTTSDSVILNISQESAPTVTIHSSKQIYNPESGLELYPLTLIWSSVNADTCSASGSWSGSKTISGFEVINSGTAINPVFSLSCTGSSGTGSNSVTVVMQSSGGSGGGGGGNGGGPGAPLPGGALIWCPAYQHCEQSNPVDGCTQCVADECLLSDGTKSQRNSKGRCEGECYAACATSAAQGGNFTIACDGETVAKCPTGTRTVNGYPQTYNYGCRRTYETRYVYNGTTVTPISYLTGSECHDPYAN